MTAEPSPGGDRVYQRVPLRDYAALLVRYLRPYRWRVGLLSLCIFSGIGARLVGPQIVRFFIDTAMAGGDLEDMVGAGTLYVIAGLGGQIFYLVGSFLGQDVGWRSTNRMRGDLAEHCLRLDLSFHNERTPGELVERVDGDTTKLSNLFSEFASQVVGSLVMLIGILVLVWREDWRVGAALSGFAVVAFVVYNLTRSIAVPVYAAEREGFARLFGFLEERLAGIEDVRTNGALGFVLGRFFRVNRDAYGRVIRSEVMGAILRSITTVLFALGHALSMGMGVWLYQEGTFSIGTVYLVFSYTSLLRIPLFLISRQINDLQMATAGLKRIEALHRIQPRIADGAGHLPDRGLSVDFEGVSFGYSLETPVLQDVSFHLPAGRLLGLLGRTGSGKTTLSRLLFRFYDVDTGLIRIGGEPIRDLSVHSLRRGVGMVTQDVQIFRASVRENLALFDDNIRDEDILSALEALDLGGWLRSLPEGLDTVITASGLSAGESQLLAFARVFLKDPGLVLLDEPSSRLDPLTERRIERAVRELLRGRTAIIIAHHLATVQRVDEILILDDGRVLEQGLRETLTADPDSEFARLLAAGLEEHIA